MDKEEYFKKSIKLRLPHRCPILEYCARRAMSIYLLSYSNNGNSNANYANILINENEVNKDFKDKVINIIGEAPLCSTGKDGSYFSNLCPEVNLFDENHSASDVYGSPSAHAVWNNNKLVSNREKHFSECAEFSSQFYISTKNKNSSKFRISRKNCYTYIMYESSTDLYKIGISNDSLYRERTLQGQQPTISLIKNRMHESRASALKLEKHLHKLFINQRIRGEWFKLNSSELEFAVTELLK